MKIAAILCASLLLLPAIGFAQVDQQKPVPTSQKFGEYTVHYNVLNSTFITPDIARHYQLTRAADQVLVNINVTRTHNGETSLGIPAAVSGTATNLMQQQKSLSFKEIDEGNATYYLAPLQHSNEELINFTVTVQPESASKPFVIKFNRTLYIEK